MIRRIAYVSRPRSGMSLVEVPRIVAHCRAHNALDGISGVLLFTGLDFAQVIEGAPDVVGRLWTRILADDRHQDIVPVLDARAQTRWFPDWRVGYPSDGALVGAIARWRACASPQSAAAGDELRRAFAAADAL
jgi:hypothetical protein